MGNHRVPYFSHYLIIMWFSLLFTDVATAFLKWIISSSNISKSWHPSKILLTNFSSWKLLCLCYLNCFKNYFYAYHWHSLLSPIFLMELLNWIFKHPCAHPSKTFSFHSFYCLYQFSWHLFPNSHHFNYQSHFVFYYDHLIFSFGTLKFLEKNTNSYFLP